MIAIINYGVGNLFSLKSSLKALGIVAVITDEAEMIRKADRIILPGVGAFGDASDRLYDTGLVPVLDQEVSGGKPLLGICLGMQLLFETSYEYGEHAGLGYLKGSIHPLEGDIPSSLSVPHIGWNRLIYTRQNDPFLKYNNEGDYVYFVHSYYAKDCDDSLVAFAEYGTKVPGYVHLNNVFGTQFHPEKSGDAGLNMLRAFNEV